MNCLEQVCDSCPVRQLVDVERAEAMYGDGGLIGFHDGYRKLATNSFRGGDSGSTDPEEIIAQRIDACNGAVTKFLSTVCVAGLGSALKLERHFPAANVATYASINNFVSSARTPKDPRGIIVDLPLQPVQEHVVMSDIIGSEAGIARGANVTLESPNYRVLSELPNSWMISITPGPSFAFKHEKPLVSDFDELTTLVYQGIFLFINARTEQLRQSQRLEQAIFGLFRTKEIETKAAIKSFFEGKFKW